MQNTKRNASEALRKLVICAVFCALAFASMFVMRINVTFLTFDAKDAVITILGLLLGPIYALGASLSIAIIEYFSVGDTGFWGLLMDFLSTATFSCVCALNYKHMKNLRGAAIGLGASVLSMTAVMLLFNLFIVPLYTPTITTSGVIAMIPTLLLPFNLTKALLNSAIVLILYKPVSKALKAVKMLPGNKLSLSGHENKKNLAMSLIVTGIGILIAVLCIVVFFVFLNGNFTLVEV